MSPLTDADIAARHMEMNTEPYRAREFPNTGYQRLEQFRRINWNAETRHDVRGAYPDADRLRPEFARIQLLRDIAEFLDRIAKDRVKFSGRQFVAPPPFCRAIQNDSAGIKAALC